MDGYFSILINEDSRQKLLENFPPQHPKVFAHHMTIAFKPPLSQYETLAQYIGQTIEMRVYGYAKDEKAEAVLVETDIFMDREYHITLSTNSVAPFYSNTFIQRDFKTLETKLALRGIFEFVDHTKLK